MAVHAGVFRRPPPQQSFAEASGRQAYWFSIAEIQEIDSMIQRHAALTRRRWSLTDATENNNVCMDRVCISDGQESIYLQKLLTDRNHTIAYHLEDKGGAIAFSSLVGMLSNELTSIYFRGLRARRLERAQQPG